MLIEDPQMMMKALRRKAYLKAIEKAPITPLFIANPIKAIRESTEGVTTWGNYPVYYGDKPLVGDLVDAFLRSLSFNPIGIAKPREIQYKETLIVRKYNDEKQDIYSAYRKLFLAGPVSRKDMADIISRIDEFNNKIKVARLDKRGLVAPIRKLSLKNIRRRFYRAPKSERLRTKILE